MCAIYFLASAFWFFKRNDVFWSKKYHFQSKWVDSCCAWHETDHTKCCHKMELAEYFLQDYISRSYPWIKWKHETFAKWVSWVCDNNKNKKRIYGLGVRLKMQRGTGANFCSTDGKHTHSYACAHQKNWNGVTVVFFFFSHYHNPYCIELCSKHGIKRRRTHLSRTHTSIVCVCIRNDTHST